MNTTSSNFDDNNFDYRSREKKSNSQGSAPNASRRSNAAARRRVKSPSQFNGMHRRRRKKINW